MASSLGDKARLLDHLVPGPILDIGAGDGALLRLARLAGHEGLGIDAAPEAVARGNRHVVPGTCPGLGKVTTGHWPNIIACSVLHEIASYGGRETWLTACLEIGRTLARGGRFIVRDGVSPAHTYQRQRITFNDPAKGLTFFDRWGAISAPLGPGRAHDHLDIAGDTVIGPAWAVTCFLMVYTWGWESLPREGREDYTIGGTLRRHGEKLAAATGLRLLHAESYTQPGYAEHLAPRCRIERDDNGHWEQADWPDTNAIWILTKD